MFKRTRKCFNYFKLQIKKIIVLARIHNSLQAKSAILLKTAKIPLKHEVFEKISEQKLEY